MRPHGREAAGRRELYGAGRRARTGASQHADVPQCRFPLPVDGHAGAEARAREDGAGRGVVDVRVRPHAGQAE